ncbi:UDP-N-acetylmuramoylalanine--D-glutamate ligase [Persephonella hydrogeniphila]|uniref:UDP-N-acetylmuramoylalanine--D-glutamate ligase n=1 Tax=Persephonella hydrogeniphila TaxID=198703 RepID=A0A285MYP7_9AQUI|nr:UDP-N-acetylmuramoyl-L-alanine--D-glutamate ligase [Persephonella hydrogeniphila]SNZ02340.1 UDP-N-acetylmuramoylalanine--D-glutamate ligase [Persephonella hydrogeniphila]
MTVLLYGKGKTGKELSQFMEKNNIPYIIRDDTDFCEKDLENVKTIVVSPGIPFYHHIYKIAKKRDIEIIGDIEYAYRLFRGCIIAITGTDGKSTTTSFVAEFLKNKKPFVGGNYGTPFIKAVEERKKLAILELSSFQIYSTKTFKPNIGVLLNIETDHLDWHKRKAHYLLSKYRMFKRMDKKGVAILNFDQELTRKVKIPARKLFFSVNRLPEGYEGIYCTGNSLFYKTEKTVNRIDISDFKLKGIHNIQNLMASVLVAIVSGVTLEEIERKIPELKSLPYRVQFIREINGIEFYNDSKSTTIQSVRKAVESFHKRNVILIIGGMYKGGDFSVLDSYKNIKQIYIIGKDRRNIRSMIKKQPVLMRQTLEKAVKDAYKNAEKGDVILFSPGCSSFDMFKNYMERGEKFNQIVESLE